MADANGTGTAFNASVQTEPSEVTRLEGKVEKLRAHLAAAQEALAAAKAAQENTDGLEQ